VAIGASAWVSFALPKCVGIVIAQLFDAIARLGRRQCPHCLRPCRRAAQSVRQSGSQVVGQPPPARATEVSSALTDFAFVGAGHGGQCGHYRIRFVRNGLSCSGSRSGLCRTISGHLTALRSREERRSKRRECDGNQHDDEREFRRLSKLKNCAERGNLFGAEERTEQRIGERERGRVGGEEWRGGNPIRTQHTNNLRSVTTATTKGVT
jgi:hypothetical protein